MQVLFVIVGVLLASNAVNGFGFGLLGGGGGGGCGCAPPAPPPCLPPPACPPPPVAVCAPPAPPPCPLPPPPAPCSCPAPAPLPPPPPPCNCPAPAPIVQACGSGCAAPAPSCGGCAPPPRPLPPPPPPAQNDCCCRCSDPCKFRKRRIAFAAQLTEGSNNPLCNSEKLRQIMLDNMSASTSMSKRAIQKAAQEKLKGRFDVICAKGDFSYLVNTNYFCQEAVNDVTCYAFRQL